MVAAVASQRTEQGARRERHLAPRQPAQAAAAGAGRVRRDRVADVLSPNGTGGQFGGYFMGCEVWASGLNPTSTGDRLGAIWSLDPEYSGLAMVIKRPPSSLTETNILNDSNRWASFARVGFGIIANNFVTSIRSVNA
jgi:hypothetical protein